MANNGTNGFGNGNGFGMRGGNPGFGLQQDDREKAVGFLNLYLPGPDGQPVKLGKGVAVRQGYAMERQLAEQLIANPAEMIRLILDNLEIRWVELKDQNAPTQGFVLKPKSQQPQP